MAVPQSNSESVSTPAEADPPRVPGRVAVGHFIRLPPIPEVELLGHAQTLQQTHEHPGVPLRWGQPVAAQAGHIQIGTTSPFLLKPVFNPYQQRRLAHLPGAEDVAKLLGLEGIVEVPVRLTLDIIGRVGLQATVNMVLKVRHDQCVRVTSPLENAIAYSSASKSRCRK